VIATKKGGAVMKVQIPARWVRYIDMVIEAWGTDKATTLERLFERGMEDTLDDIAICGGMCDFPPDMDPELLEGPSVEIEVPYEISEALEVYLSELERHFGVSRDTLYTAFFLWGLFDEYLQLKDHPRYETDPAWRELVDRMPHDSVFDVLDDEEEGEL
jgi:hypothetical protein